MRQCAKMHSQSNRDTKWGEKIGLKKEIIL